MVKTEPLRAAQMLGTLLVKAPEYKTYIAALKAVTVLLAKIADELSAALSVDLPPWQDQR